MIEINIQTDDLLKWARFMNNVPKRTPIAVSRALNTVGDNVAHNVAQYIADQTGFDPSDVFGTFEIREATPDHLTWSLDNSAMSTKMDWSRPWATTNDTGFQDRQLVKVVTRGDENVCPQCIEVADHSPYTLEEVQGMNPYGYGSGKTADATDLVHPNCRCEVQAWQATRVLPVAVAGSDAPPTAVSMKQLGEALSNEIHVMLSAINTE
jgi:hypothetical protein